MQSIRYYISVWILDTVMKIYAMRKIAYLCLL